MTIPTSSSSATDGLSSQSDATPAPSPTVSTSTLKASSPDNQSMTETSDSNETTNHTDTNEAHVVIPENPDGKADTDDSHSISDAATSSDSPRPVAESETAEDKSATKPIPISSQPLQPDEYIYHIKWIRFRGKLTPIITQNENGPCPLIAITNVLLLQKSITLPDNTEVVTGERLIAKLSDLLLSKSLQGLDTGQLLNYERTVSDALNLFPSLQTGLDVNVRFTGVSAFEFTSVLGVFDVFGIALYHGWLLDPAELELASIVGDRTYNQLVEQIIHLKASTDQEDVRKGLLADSFLEQTASQLTYHGLYELTDTLNEGQLAVLFRNNHFGTIIKNQGRIYVLVTDMGLLNEPNIVWEALDDVAGNTHFADATFRMYTPSTAATNWEYSLPINATDSTNTSSGNTTSTSTSSPSVRRAGAEVQVTTKAAGGSTTSIMKSALLRTFTGNTMGGGTNAGSGAGSKKENKSLLSGQSKVAGATPASPQWERRLSVSELARACSKQLSMDANSEHLLESDLSLAARLQLEEIESSKTNSRTITVYPEEVAKRAAEATSHTSLSADNLKEVCSEDLLEQAKQELGSGSDFDLAMHLQFEEVQQMHQTKLPSDVGGGKRAPAISGQNNVRSSASSVDFVGTTSAASPSERRRYASATPKANSSVSVVTDRSNEDEKTGCSLM